MGNANDKRPNGRGRNFTVNIRMSREEIEAARKLGGGNISQGFRHAIRYAMDREMKPIQLSTLLRSSAVLAQEMEAETLQLKHDLQNARRSKHFHSTP